jgi:hypothetical protein
VPVQVLEAVLFDVTVTVVIQITPIGVPVIEKLVDEPLVLVLGGAKNGAAPEPSSFFAVTVMVTPCGGIADVIVTERGNSTCGAGGCVEFAGGFSETTKVASDGGGGVDLLPQLPVTNKIAIIINNDKDLFISFFSEN